MDVQGTWNNPVGFVFDERSVKEIPDEHWLVLGGTRAIRPMRAFGFETRRGLSGSLLGGRAYVLVRGGEVWVVSAAKFRGILGFE